MEFLLGLQLKWFLVVFIVGIYVLINLSLITTKVILSTVYNTLTKNPKSFFKIMFFSFFICFFKFSVDYFIYGYINVEINALVLSGLLGNSLYILYLLSDN